MHEEDALLGVCHHDELGTGVKPDKNLLLDLAVGIGGRDDFDDQVGSARKVLLLTEVSGLVTSTGDESDIGSAHLVRVFVEQESSLGRHDDSEAVGLDMAGEMKSDSIRDAAMPKAWQRHTTQFPPYELVPPAVIRHTEKIVSGKQLRCESHEKSLAPSRPPRRRMTGLPKATFSSRAILGASSVIEAFYSSRHGP